MDNDSLRESISKLRKRLNITQTEMVEKLGISRNSYRNIEKGETKLINENIGKIAEVLNIPAEELLFGYSISDPDANTLEDIKEEYAKKEKSRDMEFGERIDRYERELHAQEERIRLLEDLVKTKDEIITMLKKR